MKRRISLKKTADASNFTGIVPAKPPLREYVSWNEFVTNWENSLTPLTEKEKDMVLNYLTKLHEREMELIVLKGELFDVVRKNSNIFLRGNPICVTLFKSMIDKKIKEELKKNFFNLKIEEMGIDLNLSYLYRDEIIDFKDYMRLAFIKNYFSAEVFKKAVLLNYDSLGEETVVYTFIFCLNSLGLADVRLK